MKFIVALSACAVLANLAFALDACTAKNCLVADECACASAKSPIAKGDTPQLVLLTFNDAILRTHYEEIYTTLLFDRLNPDKNHISATFFVSHEYTDYECVNKLYNKGFEIGVHGITKNELEYWAMLDKDELVDEFKGQKEIISKFANIPTADIKGVRTPFFQLNGDDSFQAYVESGLSYDSSWPALYEKNLFPYTLDFKSDQVCSVGTCPEKSYPKFWVNPVNNVAGNSSEQCNVLGACHVEGTVEEIKAWFIREFEANYNGERAPFNLAIPASWFVYVPTGYEAFKQFLDHIGSLPDAFIVSAWQAIEWRKSEVAKDKYSSAIAPRKSACKPLNCQLQKSPVETRYVQMCQDKCPANYPWIGNPEGK